MDRHSFGSQQKRWPYQVLFILLTELCERFAFYGFSGSLVYFFPRFGISSVLSTELYDLFSTIVYITPVLGAYIADTYWGRYKTIVVFCAVYIFGLMLTTAGAYPVLPVNGSDGSEETASETDGQRAWETVNLLMVVVGLFCCVTLGAGGIKSNVVVLGADQFEIPAQINEQASFFNFFYWAINIGATGAYLFLTNVALHGLPGLGIPESYGFFVSFLIPTCAFCLAVILFTVGKDLGPGYTLRPPEGSAVVDFLATLRTAVWRGRGRYLLVGAPLSGVAFLIVVASFFTTSYELHASFAIAGLGLIFVSLGLILLGGSDTNWLTHWHEGAHALAPSAAEVDAADVVRILPLAACIVVFWVIYQQMSSNFQLQGCQMDLHVGSSFKLSPATLNVFDSLVIMLLIPIVDRAVYPLLQRVGLGLGMLTKIGIGFGFAMLSVIVAGIVEIARRNAPLLEGVDGQSSCPAIGDDPPLQMSTLSIWWQVPQFMLVGLGEIFAAVTCYELFYAEVPPHMRSVCQSINLLCTAFGSLAAAGFNSVCAGWLPNNLNDPSAHLDYVFFLLGGVMALNIVLFAFLASRFTPRDDVGVLEEVRLSSAPLGCAAGPLCTLEGGVRLSRNSHAGSRRASRLSRLSENEHLDALLSSRELILPVEDTPIATRPVLALEPAFR